MNGGWFRYGQQPTAAIASWKRVVDGVRNVVTDRSRYAFLWAPNASNGYPFTGGEYSTTKASASAADFAALDTNKNGEFDALDDPYTPFYPGDDYVDWVGFSLYHYGTQYPWVTNDVPIPGKAEAILVGKPGWGHFNFYEMFCGSGAGGQPTSLSRGDKPFMVTETGSTVHMAVGPSTQTATQVPANGGAESRAQIKQGWWRQLINSTFLEQYPKIKGISTFEFIKYEETSWRDFTNMGKGTETNSPVGNDGGALDGPTLAALQADLNGSLTDLVIWGSKSAPSTGSPGSNGTSTNSPKSNSAFQTTLVMPIAALVISMLY